MLATVMGTGSLSSGRFWRTPPRGTSSTTQSSSSTLSSSLYQQVLDVVRVPCYVLHHLRPKLFTDFICFSPTGGALSRSGTTSKSDLVKVPPPSMGAEMGQLLASGTGTDYTFVIEDEEMKVRLVSDPLTATVIPLTLIPLSSSVPPLPRFPPPSSPSGAQDHTRGEVPRLPGPAQHAHA